MASIFSRMFGGGRRWNAFNNEPGSGNGSDLGTGAAGGQAGPTGAAVAPSATAAASPLDYAPLPRERIAGLRSLFTWNGWMVRSVWHVGCGCVLLKIRAGLAASYCLPCLAPSTDQPTRPLNGNNPQQGISIIQYLFVLAYCLVGIMVGLSVAQALVSGSAGYAVLYLILAPVWLLILTMILRCVTPAGLGFPAT